MIEQNNTRYICQPFNLHKRNWFPVKSCPHEPCEAHKCSKYPWVIAGSISQSSQLHRELIKFILQKTPDHRNRILFSIFTPVLSNRPFGPNFRGLAMAMVRMTMKNHFNSFLNFRNLGENAVFVFFSLQLHIDTDVPGIVWFPHWKIRANVTPIIWKFSKDERNLQKSKQLRNK